MTAPTVRVGSIVIRVDDLERQAAFWQAALGYERRPGDADDFVLLHPKDRRSNAADHPQWSDRLDGHLLRGGAATVF